jgi:hypothetical protein
MFVVLLIYITFFIQSLSYWLFQKHKCLFSKVNLVQNSEVLSRDLAEQQLYEELNNPLSRKENAAIIFFSRILSVPTKIVL